MPGVFTSDPFGYDDDSMSVSAGVPTSAEVQEGGAISLPTTRGTAATIGGAALLGIPDLVDVVSSSIGLTERGDLNQKMFNFIGKPGLSKFASDIQGATEVASGLYGIVASDLVARGLLKPAGMAMQGLSKLPYAGRIAKLDASYSTAMQTLRQAELNSARMGSFGADQYLGNSAVAGAAMSRLSAYNNVTRTGFALGARNAATTELVMAATLNQNDFLFDDELSTNMAWAAFGIGVGGFVERAAAKYGARKIASGSDVISRQIQSVDPSFGERTRLNYMQVGPLDELAPAVGRFTDSATGYFLNAQALKSSPIGSNLDAVTLQANRDKIAVQNRQLGREELGKATVKGWSHDGRTRFSIGSSDRTGKIQGAEGYSNHVNEIENNDPAGFYGLEAIGAIPENTPSALLYEQHKKRLAERITETEEELTQGALDPARQNHLQKLRLSLAAEEKLVPVGFLDGHRVPFGELALDEAFLNPTPVDFEFVRNTAKLDPLKKAKGPEGFWSIMHPETRKTVGTIDNNLEITTQGNKPLEQLGYNDIKYMYALGRKAIQGLKGSQEFVRLGKKPTWFQLDLAEELLQQTDGAARIMWPAGMSRESAQVESFAQKAEIVRKIDLSKRAKGEKGLGHDQLMHRLIVGLNMPRLSAYEMGLYTETLAPAVQLLRGAAAHGPDKLRGMSLADVKKLVSEYQALGDMGPTGVRDVKTLTGNSFFYGVDRHGQPMKPMAGLMRPFKSHEWIVDDVNFRVAQQLATSIKIMSEGDDFTKLLMKELAENPDAQAAARVDSIRETQLTGDPTSLRTQAGRAVLSSDHVVRDSPHLQAAGKINDVIGRLSQNYVNNLFNQVLGDSINQLANSRNSKSVLLLDSYFSFGRGWDKAKPVKQGDFWVFPLAKSAENNRRWKAMYGTPMPDGSLLTSPNGVPVALDDLGMDLTNRFQQLTDARLEAANTVLRGRGMRQVERKDYFVPSPKMDGKFIGFVFGPDGNGVPGMGVIAKTEAEFATKKAKLIAELQNMDMGYNFRSLNEIQEFGSMFDKALTDFLSPGTIEVAAGKTNRGILIQQQVETGAFSSALRHLREQMVDHGRTVLGVAYDPSIKSAIARSRISAVAQPNKTNMFKDVTRKNVYELYQETLLGKSKLHSTSSLAGRMYNGAEGLMDALLGSATPKLAEVTKGLEMHFSRLNPWSRSAGAQKDFQSLSKALGQYMPFENQADMLESAGFGAKPWTSKEAAGKLNNFAASLSLRFMETAHAAVTLGGLVASSPAVVRSFLPMAGETFDDAMKRVGHIGIPVHLPGGSSFIRPSPEKIVAQGLKAALQKENHPVWDSMVKRGMVSQEIAELHKQLGALESRGTFKKILFGDPTIHNPKGIVSTLKSKGLVNSLSILSDTAEDFSRAASSMIGYELAKSIGISTEGARLSFAHDVANKIIANYAPQNRAEVFQGTLGTTVGLFKTFMQNYYQRLFRYVETKNWNAMASQYLTQGALFGAGSIPGFDAFSSVVQYLEDDHTSGVDALRARFGGAADLVEGGAISNLPAIFGQPAIDLYTRGDVNPILPGTDLFKSAEDAPIRVLAELSPGLAMLGKISDGILGGIAAVWRDKPDITTGQMIEIASNAIPNRPISGLMEVLNGGMDTDKVGQLVAETQSSAETLYRLMGVRSMRQSKEIEVFYSDKTAQEYQSAVRSQFNLALRSAIREGRFDELYDTFEQSYLEMGGDPKYWKKAIKDAHEAALETRSSRQLEKALRNPARAAQAQKYLDAGVSVDSYEDDAKLADDAFGMFYPEEKVQPQSDIDEPGLIKLGGSDELTDPDAALQR